MCPPYSYIIPSHALPHHGDTIIPQTLVRILQSLRGSVLTERKQNCLDSGWQEASLLPAHICHLLSSQRWPQLVFSSGQIWYYQLDSLWFQWSQKASKTHYWSNLRYWSCCILFRRMYRKHPLRLFGSYDRNNNTITVPWSSVFQ